ncbi:YhcH/YjgK/YiaL family protein [Paenibacillus fonticola]|uniref:YhcH/YjgK/YiaL family protein n=1 Tax=Paenibacillus fonticola TaxID=379896 RepID=UPI00035C17F6|nr:YhcH/YjgK/YiaL family protein [Paenibacillus fonticola]
MILGDIRNLDQEKHLYPSAVRRGLEYIKLHRLEDAPLGKYELESGQMFAIVQEYATQPISSQQYESHYSYIDIQYVVSGTERIGWRRYDDHLKISVNRLCEEDIQFYEDSCSISEAESLPGAGQAGGSDLIMEPGMFAVFYPTDLHRPCGHVHGESSIRKIVIKIHRSLVGM